MAWLAAVITKTKLFSALKKFRNVFWGNKYDVQLTEEHFKFSKDFHILAADLNLNL